MQPVRVVDRKVNIPCSSILLKHAIASLLGIALYFNQQKKISVDILAKQ